MFIKPFQEKRHDGTSFLPEDKKVIVRYLIKCFDIIKNCENNKSFLILSRNRRIKGVKQNEIKNILKLALKNRIKKEFQIEFKTMHKSKGLEKDIVIILDAVEKTIPSIHPSNELFKIFNQTPDKVLDEEKHLFYVAITRAKKQLYILAEHGIESEFLQPINLLNNNKILISNDETNDNYEDEIKLEDIPF